MDKIIARGFKEAQKLTKRYAKTFYFASKLLGRKKRQAAYSVYAICRISDDSVDGAGGCLEKLKIIEKKIDSAYSSSCFQEPLSLAFKNTVNTYNIPKCYFDQLIKGMYLDLEKKNYANFDELYNYCYKVAGVVGLVMLQIFGCQNEKAKQSAVDLGIAMQLTNILRDIKEDLDRGRRYLPLNELKDYHIEAESLKLEKVSEEFVSLLKFQIQRARTYYQSSDKGIRMIADRRSRLVVCAMSKIYEAILGEIEKNNYDIFSSRASVSGLAKLGLLVKIIIDGKYL